MRYVYIPATRSVQDFRRGVFVELISGAVSRIAQSRRRLEALQRVYADIRTEVEAVERDVVQELQQYIPSVRSLHFDISELELERLVSVSDVEIDDGARTPLQQKGDGFKSVFSISLLQYLARQRHGKTLIFGIEEPESHLHSSAIYEIKETLRSLSTSFQVLITTHSPILIQRDRIESNVILRKVDGEHFSSTAQPARNLADVRTALGIRAHENMTTAEVVVVVEGATEERVLAPLFSRVDARLEGLVEGGRIRVLGAGGAGNIGGVVRALARDATSCIVLLDSDAAGDDAAIRISRSGLIAPSDILRVPAREGCAETEFEDVFSVASYVNFISTALALPLNADQFEAFRALSGRRGNRCAKWSVVMESICRSAGLDWQEHSETAKRAFADGVVADLRAGTLPVENILWLEAMCARIVSYLRGA